MSHNPRSLRKALPGMQQRIVSWFGVFAAQEWRWWVEEGPCTVVFLEGRVKDQGWSIG